MLPTVTRIAVLCVLAGCSRADDVRQRVVHETAAARASRAVRPGPSAPDTGTTRSRIVLLEGDLPHPDVAGEPYRDWLTVRVRNRAWQPMSGQRIDWIVRRGGGSVAAERDTTDATGIARARWTPGVTADTQVVVALLAGVDSIEFRSVVRVARLTLSPESPSGWTGDERAVTAAAFDSKGHRLTGATVACAVTDTSIARTFATAGGCSVLYVHAGESVLRVSAPGDATSSTIVTTLSTMNIVAYLADGSAASGALALLNAGSRIERGVLGAEGTFTTRLAAPLVRTATLRLEPGSSGQQFAPARLDIAAPQVLEELSCVLVPLQWTVRSGTWSGTTLAIDVGDATHESGQGASFWRVVTPRGSDRAVSVGWSPSAFPLRVAFHSRVSAADSTSFWRTARQLEADVGRTLFAPATGDADIEVEIDAGTSTPGRAFITWNARGDIYDALVSFRGLADLRDDGTVTHELLHAIGIGHTNQWTSVMHATATGVERATRIDVAYVQLLMAARALERSLGASVGLANAVAPRGSGESRATMP